MLEHKPVQAELQELEAAVIDSFLAVSIAASILSKKLSLIRVPAFTGVSVVNFETGFTRAFACEANIGVPAVTSVSGASPSILP